MTTKKWLKKYAPDLSGKRIAVSGSTGGLGRALIRHFATLGASIIMLDRNEERASALAKELKADFPALKTEYIPLDLEDIGSVKRAADILSDTPPDYLILNAGAYHIPLKQCALGYNNVFQINFASPYYLACRLEEKIASRGGRIIAVGSIAHGYSKADPCDIDFSTRKKSSLIYGNAKRYLMYSLASLGSGTVEIAHPGITFTNITAHYPKLIFAIIKHPMKVIFMKTKRASLSVISAMADVHVQDSWTGPSLFGIWGLPKRVKLKSISAAEREHILSTARKVIEKTENYK